MDLLKSKDGQIVFYHGAEEFLDPIALRYWTPSKAPTIAHNPLSVQIFFQQKRIAWKFTTMRAPLYMIHGIVTILNACLIEHGFSYNGFQIISSLISVLERK